MRLVIGLGNPGDRHMNNRRNIGFKVVDVISNNTNIQIKTKKKKSLLGMGDFEGHNIVLLKPQTFIDLSGEAVLYIASFLRIPVENVIVIHEDYNLEFRKVQVAVGNCETFHVGVQSIAEGLKSNKFVRIRVGIGPLPSGRKIIPDYTGNIHQNEIGQSDQEEINSLVLNDFSPKETLEIIEIINDAEAALRSVFTQDIKDVLSRYKLGKAL